MTGNCELCHKHREIEKHHYLPRARLEDTNLISLCFYCHQDVHNLCNDKFLKKYGIKRSEFIKVREV